MPDKKADSGKKLGAQVVKNKLSPRSRHQPRVHGLVLSRFPEAFSLADVRELLQTLTPDEFLTVYHIKQFQTSSGETGFVVAWPVTKSTWPKSCMSVIRRTQIDGRRIIVRAATREELRWSTRSGLPLPSSLEKSVQKFELQSGSKVVLLGQKSECSFLFMPEEQDTRVPELGHKKENRNPKVLALKRGNLGHIATQLVYDFRTILRPNTEFRLAERRCNKMHDYLRACGPAGISHLAVFCPAQRGVSLRIIKTPQGPTVHFNVLSYTLQSDLRQLQAVPHGSEHDYHFTPLVILDGFNSATANRPHIGVVATLFRHMFPPLSLQDTPLSAVRRAVLFSYDAASDTILVRHYALSLRDSADSTVMPLSALLAQGEKSSLDLGHFDSVQEYIDMQRGSASGHQTQRKTLGVYEIGPRLTLQVLRIEDGVDAGAVLYHRLVEKTADERAFLASRATQMRADREHRLQSQERASRRRRQEIADEARDAAERQDRQAEAVLRRSGYETNEEGDLVAGEAAPRPGDSADLYTAESRQERHRERDRMWRSGRIEERRSRKAQSTHKHSHRHRGD